MSTTWRAGARASRLSSSIRRRCLSTDGRFEVSDFVMLRETKGRSAPMLFFGPLTPGKIVHTHKGTLIHDDLIGLRPRDVFETKTINGKEDSRYRLHEVRLEDYVLNSRRLVTPIYPHDASLIVSLFDLHPEPQETSDSPQIELLEAGTGHGALTLHLSRAVHAANGASPKAKNFDDTASFEEALHTWKSKRQAIIHSIERHDKYSKHASKTVQQFRQGQYHGNIDFHVSDVGPWVQKALEQRGQPFLTHAFLDLPDVHKSITVAGSALKTNGTMIVFCPSITQIISSAYATREEGTLDLERVVELGVNGGSGGRLWDVRLVKPRKQAVPMPEDDISSEESATDTSVAGKDEADWQMVCRPKVGDRIAGGGFLAVFKKKSPQDTQDTLQSEIV